MDVPLDMDVGMDVNMKERNERKRDYHKVVSSIEKLCYNLDMSYVSPFLVASQVIHSLYSGITTVILDADDLAAKIAATLAIEHPDYDILAVRILVSNLHKQTKNSFSEVMHDLYYAKKPFTWNEHTPIISKHYYNIIKNNAEKLDSAIIYDRDFNYNYIGFKTLQNSYLLKINDTIVERPQHMLMRVAVGIHEDDIDKAIETYNYLSEGYFTHASPTSFNACINNEQMPSCFLLTLHDSDINKYAIGVYTTMEKCGLISKHIGGRSGTFATYLEPWHANIFDFLERKKYYSNGKNMRADLFDSMWIPDLFMERVHNDQLWSLMNPYESFDLTNVWGDEFTELYIRYERERRYRKQVKARDVWAAILKSQVQTGTPYMIYKDNYNRKSNHRHLGTFKCNNVWCTTVIDYSNPEKNVCNLESIAINMFVNTDNKTFDFEKLKTVTKIVTRNLDKVIDVIFCPIPDNKTFNQRNRPIGIGVQGLADAFLLMRYPFDSKEAKELNIKIFETLYYGALEASCELAAEKGTYKTYQGSPISQGILQYDMWNVKPTDLWDWDKLKAKIAKHGVRNSLLIAPMPTTSTSLILGNNDSTEPYTSNIYVRRVSSEEFVTVNPHLLRDLIAKGLWNKNVKDNILSNFGSIKKVNFIPDDLKMLYKTVWEIPQKVIFEMAADRGAFIDQSQSLNVHIQAPTSARLATIHFLGWRSGLKTGVYHLRTKPDVYRLKTKPDAQDADKSKCQKPKLITDFFVKSLKNNDNYDEFDRQIELNHRVAQSYLAMLNCSRTKNRNCFLCNS